MCETVLRRVDLQLRSVCLVSSPTESPLIVSVVLHVTVRQSQCANCLYYHRKSAFTVASISPYMRVSAAYSLETLVNYHANLIPELMNPLYVIESFSTVIVVMGLLGFATINGYHLRSVVFVYVCDNLRLHPIPCGKVPQIAIYSNCHQYWLVSK